MATSSKPTPAEAEVIDETETDDVQKVTFTVDLRGKKVTITCPKEMEDGPIEVLEAYEAGQNLKAFMSMIGPQQAAKLRAAGMTIRQFNDIVAPAYEKAAGTGEG